MSTATTRVIDDPTTFRAQMGILWRYRRLIGLGVVMGVLGALALALIPGSSYTSTADVLVRVASQTPFQSGDVTKQISMQTEIEVAESQGVAEGALRGNAEGIDPAALSRHLRVANLPDTMILRFAFTDSHPAVAASWANQFAKSYLADRQARTLRTVNDQVKVLNDEMKTLTTQLASLDKQKIDSADGTASAALEAQRNVILQEMVDIKARLTDAKVLDATPGYVVRAASVPTVPDGPSLPAMLVLGGLLGLVFGVAMAWTAGWVRREQQVEDPVIRYTGTELLSTMRRLELRPGLDDWVGLRASEAASTLALTLTYGRDFDKVRALLVTQTRATDGSRSVAVDLSLALVEMGRTVALLEADFRAPTLAGTLPFVPEQEARIQVSLFEGAAGPAPLAVAQHWPEVRPMSVHVDGPGRLHLYPGVVEERPLEALNRPAVHSFVTGLRDEYDFVVVVVPGLLSFVDGLELIHLLDGALLVSDARDVSGPDLEAASAYITRVGGRLVGAVSLIDSAGIVA
jgi:succinoglycan biosynthesis transport protein ExoP